MNVKKTSFKILFAFVIIGLFFSFSCNAQTETIVIFHMNDVHAKIDNFAKIAWIIKQEKEKNPNVFVMNAGDNFSGNPVVDQYKPKGKPILELLKLLKVDVLALGNHDFDYGQEILKNAMADAGYPMICANIQVVKGQGIIPQPEPYTVVKTRNGTKIAVLGLIQVEEESGIPSTHPKKIEGLVFSNGIAAAKKFRHLKKENDLLIALSHLGYDDDEKLAGEMRELDIIIGGHSHTTIKEPKEINGVMITQAGGYCRYLGRVQLTVENGKIIGKKGELIELKTVTNEIPEIKEKIAKYNDNPELKRVIAALPKMVQGKFQLGNLISDAVRIIHRQDIAVHNYGGIRSRSIGKEVLLQDVYKLLPFGNDIVQFEMTPTEIKTLFKNDYQGRKRFDLGVSGIRYTVITTPAADGKVDVKDVELRDNTGALLDETKTYKVGMNNYMASTYKFTHRDAGRALQTTIAETLIDYLQSGADVCKDIEKNRTHLK
ncbi:MAG: bifunctional metallophosphatase/5'-nucleotidase [bacterium]|nr:bifunctional metallophosphatase/5'-nucleotidase [bacterium]